MALTSSNSPTLVNEKSSLDIMSSIAESFSFIARDLVEYVKIKTGKKVSSSSPTVDTSSRSLSPTPEIDFVSGKKPAEKKKGFFAKMMDMFSPGNIMKALLGLALIAGIVAVMWPSIKEAFTTFFTNIWESIKEGLDKIGEWFMNLFDKAGELLSGLGESISDFMAPVIESFVSFVSGITDWFGDKFAAIKEFLFGSKTPDPTGTPTGTPDSNTVDTKNVPSHLTSSMNDDMDIAMAGDQSVMKGDPRDIERTRREIKARDKKSNKARDKKSNKARDKKDNTTKKLDWYNKSGKVGTYGKPNTKTPSAVTNERPVIGGEKASSTTPTPSSSSGGMDDTKAMIIQHEGIAERLPNGEYKPYQDTRGLWTIGVGHLIGKGKTLPPEMDRNFSHEEVMNMFDDDFAHHKKIAEQTPGYGKANEAGKSAFVDLAFNMGKWWPKFPNAAKALGEGNFSLASNELQDSAWYGQVGVRGPKIVNLVAQAGSSQGTTLAANSNSNSIEKRGMSMGGGETVVNSGTVNNNTIVKNDIVVASKQDNTGRLTDRIS
jgi:lysozyme